MISIRWMRWAGEPERDSSWVSAGKRWNSTSLPSSRRATNSSSAWLIGQRRSSSEWMISSGVSMSRTKRMGDMRA